MSWIKQWAAGGGEGRRHPSPSGGAWRGDGGRRWRNHRRWGIERCDTVVLWRLRWEQRLNKTVHKIACSTSTMFLPLTFFFSIDFSLFFFLVISGKWVFKLLQNMSENAIKRNSFQQTSYNVAEVAGLFIE